MKPLYVAGTERDLARHARTEPDARVRQRILAIRLLVMGQTVPQAAPIVGLKERQVRNWVHRFQAEGLEGLRDRPRPGQPKHLPTEKEEAFKARIRRPPRGMILRGPDVRRLLKEEFGAAYSLGGVYFLLHRLGFSSLSPRPLHPQTDKDAQDDFKKTR
ncbi:MAG: transposase [Planctomycetes bacterium]|nr:transposase [Planctomycetota bacterium]